MVLMLFYWYSVLEIFCFPITSVFCFQASRSIMDLPSYFKIWMTSLEIFPIVVISFRASFILGHIDIGGGAANWTNEKRVHITLRFTPTDKTAFPFSSSSKTLFLFIICHSHSWTWTSPALWQNERDMGSHYPRLSASFTAIDHYPKGPFGQNWLCSEGRVKEKGFLLCLPK